MATTTTARKPQRSPEEIEDIILRKIFLVSLTDSESSDPRIVYLELTAAEILSESKELRLSRDLMERILIDRLSASATAEPPFQYLVGCYRRAYDESKKISSMKDPNLRSQLDSVIKQAKKLCISYCRIHLENPKLFPNNEVKSGTSPCCNWFFLRFPAPLMALEVVAVGALNPYRAFWMSSSVIQNSIHWTPF